MKKFFWIAIIGLAMIGTGCSSIGVTPQSIDITSQPPGAAVSINEEYIGNTPITHHVKDVNQHDSLVIKLEKLCYESNMKRLQKKGGGIFSSGKFPEKQNFVLQPIPICSLPEREDALQGEE
jgi:hypothetical protein